MSIQRRADELVDLLRPDFVGNDGTASPSFVWVCAGFGTAAAPGFRFCADPDTGFYRPTANEIGIVTAGGEQVRIDSSGRVGINTTNPQDILDIGPAGANIGKFRFQYNPGEANSRDWQIRTDLVVYGDFAIRTTDAQDHVIDLTRLYIDDSGNTSIGVLPPQDRLDLGTGHLRFQYQVAQAASRDWQIRTDLVVYGDFAIRTTDAQDHTIDLTRLYIDASGNVTPNPATTKVQNLGLAASRWNVVFSGAADNVGTSRIFEIEKSCPVCDHRLIKGTGAVCILGEDRDYETAFCPECGAVIMDEVQHLPVARLAERRPAPTITFLGFEAFIMSGNSHKVRADFQYGHGESAQYNSTYLGESERASFLQMDESERAVYLRALGQREWDALEEMRLMETICKATQAQFSLAGAALVGRDLQRL